MRVSGRLTATLQVVYVFVVPTTSQFASACFPSPPPAITDARDCGESAAQPCVIGSIQWGCA